MAAATATLLGIAATDAMALSLGRLTVQSALGEPLRAEIDILDINADEAASLRTSIAPPNAFAAAGLEYNAAVGGLQTSLQRRSDGRSFIRLSSDRTVNDPFVDLILEVNWASGRIVRDYTMLFDPPALRSAATPAPTLAQTPAPAVATPKAPAPSTPPVAEAPAAAVPAPVAVARPTSKAEPAPKPKPKTETTEAAREVTVKAGDTASKIAGSHKPAGISLDQMLVAMLATNPDAFVNDNMNRLRKGAIVTLPTQEQAQAVPAAKATQIVLAQSKDFNGFRKNLANSAPLQSVDTSTQKASGKIESKLEDKKPATLAPDKLTLNKGSVQAKIDDKIAKERAAEDAKARAAELEKNIADLKKIGATTAPAAAPAAQTSAPASPAAATVAAPTLPATATSAPQQPASAPEQAASAPAKTPVVDTPVPASVQIEEVSLVDELIDNPMTPIAAGGLIALIAGLGFWRIRQRKKNSAQVDSSFLESRLQPDSFFGASGGQRIDTANEGGATGSSMVYSPSQLDAADDVDPVAEADVYLAYGRDLQAEEILKEAAKTSPGRLAIHTKLLEIFAKRRDARSFEASATQAFKITGANSPDWTRICETGLGLDPQNPLYQPGGAPVGADASAISPSSFEGTMRINVPVEPVSAPPASGVDLDLDLDFSLDDEPASAINDVTGGSAQPVSYDQTVKMDQGTETPAAATADDGSLDFDLPEIGPASASFEPVVPSLPEISLDLAPPATPADSGLNFDTTNTAPMEIPSATPSTPAAGNDGMLEFDLGSLAMELDVPTPAATAPELPTEAPSAENEDPLETKLALAEEFVSIGDEDGARALIEEVLTEATGATREKAQRALSQLS